MAIVLDIEDTGYLLKDCFEYTKEVRNMVRDECSTRETISHLAEDFLKIGFGLDITYSPPYLANSVISDELAGI